MLDVKGENNMKLTASLLCLMMLTGCAGVVTKGIFSHVGEADPTQEKQINNEIAQIKKKYEPPKEEVKVFIDTIPEGLVYQNHTLSVADGYDHKLLGKFSAAPDPFIYYAVYSNAFKYKDPWRNAYCNFHAVIPFLFLSPTFWVAGCYPSNVVPHEDLINTAKNVAVSAGGDMVLGSYSGSRPDKSTAIGFSGWVVKMDKQFKGKAIKSTPTKIKGQQ
jgi:hypothetical protein